MSSIAICNDAAANGGKFAKRNAETAKNTGMSIAVQSATPKERTLMTISIDLKEDLDAAAMDELRPQFESLAAGNSDVELDLSNVRFMDSSGVGGFVFLYKRLRASGHNLWLTGVTNQPRRLLSYVGLLDLASRADADVRS